MHMLNFDSDYLSPTFFDGNDSIFGEKDILLDYPGDVSFRSPSDENDGFLSGLCGVFQPSNSPVIANTSRLVEERSPRTLSVCSPKFDFSLLQSSLEGLRGGRRFLSEQVPSSAPEPAPVPQIEKNVDLKLCQSDRTRTWQEVYSGQSFEGCIVSITMKNRVEKATPFVPEIFYSSIQYQIQLEVESSIFESAPYSFLLAKIYVLDSETGEKLSGDLKGKAPIKGTVEAACCKQTSNKCLMKGLLKTKLGDLTYHKSGKHYMLQIEFYLPDDMNHAVISYRSPVFRVYARKPNKRKRKGDGSAKKVVKAKKRKVQKKKKQTSSAMDIFKEKLSSLIDCHTNLESKNKKVAYDMMVQKIFQEFNPHMFVMNN